MCVTLTPTIGFQSCFDGVRGGSMEFEFGSMWFEWFEIVLVDKNRKNLLGVCERLDASCCYEWFCLLVSELTICQIHSYQHPSGSHTQRTINRRFAHKPFFRSTQTFEWFERFETFERFEWFLMECLLKNHFQVRVEKCFFVFVNHRRLHHSHSLIFNSLIF